MRPVVDEETSRHERIALSEAIFSPPTDVYVTAERVVVSIELPGVSLESVTLSTDEDGLSVSGSRGEVSQQANYHRLERSHGEFAAHVHLPPDVDPGQRTVRLHDGVLSIELKRKAGLT